MAKQQLLARIGSVLSQMSGLVKVPYRINYVVVPCTAAASASMLVTLPPLLLLLPLQKCHLP